MAELVFSMRNEPPAMTDTPAAGDRVAAVVAIAPASTGSVSAAVSAMKAAPPIGSSTKALSVPINVFSALAKRPSRNLMVVSDIGMLCVIRRIS